MKKTIICNIPMKEQIGLVTYESEDKSIIVKPGPVRFPINAMIDDVIEEGDELKVLILIKKDGYENYMKNTEDFKKEFLDAVSGKVSNVNFITIDTEFEQSKAVYEQLLGRLTDELEVSSHILVDVTYGPKDLPVVIFAALNFAEQFLDCTIENIIYGKASFMDDKVVDTKICDMSPLYYLNSITNTIRCDDPEKARSMLKTLLSF